MESHVNSYKHKVLKDKRLIIEVLSGSFTIKTIQNHREVLYSDRFFNPTFDIFHDIRGAYMNFSAEELNRYLQHLDDIKAMSVRKTVILTTPENHEKVAQMFDSLGDKFPVQFKVYPSYSDSVRWLEREYDSEEINRQLETLRGTSCPECLLIPNAFTGF